MRRQFPHLAAATALLILVVGCAQRVPNVEGLQRSEVVEQLAEKGMTADFSEVYSDSVPPGQVVSSEPEAGETLTRSDKVLVKLSKGAEPTEVAPDPLEFEIWWPDGFVPITLDVAARYTTESYPRDPCGYSACDYWVIEVVSKNGCPQGLFVEMNILRNSLVIDWGIESVSSLRAGQIAELVFTKRNLGSGTFEAEFSSANCY